MRTQALLCALFLAACGNKNPTPAPAPPEPAASPAPAEPDVSGRIAGTGPLSEEQFKAMHALRDDAPPALKGEMIDLAGTKAYLSLPEGVEPPMAGIVVIHEWWGLNDHIKHWADRLATLGIAALAVDLYGGVVATDRDTAMAAMKQVDAEEGRRVVAAAYDFLGSDPRVQAARRGVIGWCFGGAWAIEAAIARPFDAAVAYYGHVETDPARLAKIEGQVLGIFATEDQGIPLSMVAEFEQALAKAKVEAKILRFEADHAFANPSGDRYQEAEAAAAWDATADFLQRTLQK